MSHWSARHTCTCTCSITTFGIEPCTLVQRYVSELLFSIAMLKRQTYRTMTEAKNERTDVSLAALLACVLRRRVQRNNQHFFVVRAAHRMNICSGIAEDARKTLLARSRVGCGSRRRKPDSGQVGSLDDAAFDVRAVNRDQNDNERRIHGLLSAQCHAKRFCEDDVLPQVSAYRS